ncbi:YggT family protein [Paenibacillus chartarius]|uniref:YggT family protein n=1 Tax=Paenibacillus chartarius TaxID=747481 RepID=A0ABV6DNG1_9BACL
MLLGTEVNLLLITVISAITVLEQIYTYMIIGYILLSWFPNARESFIGNLLGRLTEPYLSIFRRIIPSIGPIDISPIVALIALNFVGLGLKVVVQYVLGLFL